jgi:hypothetical protein
MPINDSPDPPPSPTLPHRSTPLRMFPLHLNNYAATCELDPPTTCFVTILEGTPDDDLQFEDVCYDPN